MPISIAENRDCMLAMAEFPDKFFDLAIVDPPYGIGVDGFNTTNKSGTKGSFYEKKGWDNKPETVEFFSLLFQKTKNQIIWGANHFISKIPIDSSCWLVWDKNRGDQCFADAELAWTSFSSVVKLKKITWDGFRQDDMKNKELRIHPTQKPIQLYNWLLKKYAKNGDNILDTHLGSGSSRIAAYNLGFDFWGYEIDKEYFDAQEARFNGHSKDGLFGNVETNIKNNLFGL